MLLLIATCLFSNNAFAEAVEIDGIYYNLVTKIKEAEVTRNPNEYTGTVNIPETVTYNGVTYSVTSIGETAFFDCFGLASVTIPNSVTSIGNRAFYYCSGLTSVTIPNSVTSIEYRAFYYCSRLTSVTIGNSVSSIGNSAFYGCSGLTSVTIPNSVTSIGESAFSCCFGLTSITIPNSVTSIGTAAFYYCSGLTSVTIGNLVTSIGRYAFQYCSGLTSVNIPNSVTSIGSWAFEGCSSLTTINVEAGNTVYDSRNNCNAIIETSTNTLITGCKNTTIPNSVTSIGEYAFYGCSGLTYVTIPNSVTSIGEGAFCECGGLTSVNIGNSVKSIGEYAFAACAELTDVYCYAENVPFTKSDAFAYSNYESATLHVPAAFVEDYKTTEPWSNFGAIVPLTDEDAVAEVQAVPVLIQTQGNTITVEGAEAGTEIILYGTNGVQLDSVIATIGVASLSTSRLSGSVAIVKIGNKTVKVQIKQ